MFRDTFFSDFDEDPFFSMHRDRVHRMDEMFGGLFGGSGVEPLMAITDGPGDRQRHRQHADRSRTELEPRRSRSGTELMHFSGDGAASVWDPFSHMNSMMSSMHSMIGNVFQQMGEVRNDPNSHSYVQSSVMTYSNTGQGEPKIYQATTATRQAPGGIRETRKAVRDSEAGIEKISVGRHLKDKGHVVTRQRNTRTGDFDENQDYMNLDEDEAPQFDEEWRNVTSRYTALGGRRLDGQSQSRQHHAVDDREYHHHRAGGNSNNAVSGHRHSTNKYKAIEQGRRVERAY